MYSMWCGCLRFHWLWMGLKIRLGRCIRGRTIRGRQGGGRVLEGMKRILRTHGAWWDRPVRLFLTHGPLGDTGR